MVLSAKISGSDDLKAIISAISTVVEEATFVANSEGITFRGMDPSHVALIDISWPNSAFEKYECDSDLKFGVRIDEISKLIKRADKKDTIQIGISEDNMLLVSIGKNKKYKIRLVESAAAETPLPKIPYDAKIDLVPGALDKILGDIQVISEYMTIKASKSSAVFSGKGDTGEALIEMEKDGEIIKSIETKSDSKATYSLEYLSPVVKAVGTTASSVSCEFSNEKPLRIEFKIAGIGRIHFYLAPRVET